MKGKLLALASIFVAQIAPSVWMTPAAATTVTWSLNGTLNVAEGTNPLSSQGVGIGSPFTFTMTYDSSAASPGGCNPGVPGTSPDGVTNCWRRYSPASLTFTIDFGVDCDPKQIGYQPCRSGPVDTNYGFIRVYNDYNNGTDVFDQLSIRMYEQADVDETLVTRWTLVIGSFDLSTLSDLSLPAGNPPFRWFNLGVCKATPGGACDTTNAWRVDDTDGTIPEPGTLALLGLGLAGLATVRRRRR